MKTMVIAVLVLSVISTQLSATIFWIPTPEQFKKMHESAVAEINEEFSENLAEIQELPTEYEIEDHSLEEIEDLNEDFLEGDSEYREILEHQAEFEDIFGP